MNTQLLMYYVMHRSNGGSSTARSRVCGCFSSCFGKPNRSGSESDVADVDDVTVEMREGPAAGDTASHKKGMSDIGGVALLHVYIYDVDKWF